MLNRRMEGCSGADQSKQRVCLTSPPIVTVVYGNGPGIKGGLF